MRKPDLVSRVVEQTGLSSRKADDVVFCTFEQIINALARGESIRINGFGAFSVKERAARTGYHPITKESIDIGSSNYVSFKAADKIRKLLTVRCQKKKHLQFLAELISARAAHKW